MVSASGPESIVTAGACVSTVNAALATAPAFPAPSVATTSKVCSPSESGVSTGYGDSQVARSPSSEHAKLAPSSDANSKVGVASFVSSPGARVILNCGATVSTVSSEVATAPTLPAASVATTSKR